MASVLACAGASASGQFLPRMSGMDKLLTTLSSSLCSKSSLASEYSAVWVVPMTCMLLSAFAVVTCCGLDSEAWMSSPHVVACASLTKQ